jgi:uncharacterized protein YdaT
LAHAYGILVKTGLTKDVTQYKAEWFVNQMVMKERQSKLLPLDHMGLCAALKRLNTESNVKSGGVHTERTSVRSTSYNENDIQSIENQKDALESF